MPLLLSFVSFLLNPFYLQGQQHHGRSRRKIYYSEERFGEHVATDLKPGCEEIPLRHPVYPGVLRNSSMHL